MNSIDWTLILIGAGIGCAVLTLGTMIVLGIAALRRKPAAPEPEWQAEDDGLIEVTLDAEVAIQQAQRMIGASSHRINVMQTLIARIRELESECERQSDRADKLARIARVIEESS